MGAIQPVCITLIEPSPAPVIPVTGVGLVKELPGDMMCVTHYQDIPSHDASGPTVEHHIMVHLLWPRLLMLAALQKFPAQIEMALETAEQVLRGAH